MTGDGQARFVIAHHLATADHYDFRLEIGGVLVSWAVPKGLSTDPRQRRLAKRTGDHALGHLDYEGVLSPVRRGGGIVQVWDTGTFDNVSHDEHGAAVTADIGLARGHLSVVLHGVKRTGGYSVLRTRGDDLWLVIKKRDGAAGPDQADPLDESVLTGRTLAQIEDDG